MRRHLHRAAMALLVLAAGACREAPSAEAPPFGQAAAVSIAAASNLRFALDEVIDAYRAEHGDTPLSVTYGSSGSFFAQIVNGAPFDLYLPADMEYARRLVDRRLADSDTLFTYAHGLLAVWVPAASGLDIEGRGLLALADPGVAHVAIANPALAPYGAAAEEALREAGLSDIVEPKLVLGENVSQAFQFVQSGAADAGIVALSLALAPGVAASGRYALLSRNSYTGLEQGGVILAGAPREETALSVRAFMLGETAGTILKRYGYELPVR